MTENEPSWDHYRTFLAVLKDGSLSKAARSLNLAQPTLGRHIDSLEQSLNFSLFVRSQNGFEPTEAALKLKPYAESLQATAAALLREASGQGEIVKGTVRITASEIISIEILPPIFSKLNRQYPHLTIELDASNKSKDLLSREADIAVRMFRPTQQSLITRKVGRIELGWHAHKDYLARCGTPKNNQDLVEHSLIGYETETGFLRNFKKNLKLPESKIFSFRSDNDLAQLAAIRNGCGVGLCQAALAKKDSNLVRVLPKLTQIYLETWITMHENLKTNPRCRVVFDALTKGLIDYIGTENK